MSEPWWKSAVIYQIYPRSFADSDGDGVGDLEGIRRHLDHLAWLGVDGIWLSPIYRSPMADLGYDVADYTDVDPIFGALADLDRLVADLADRDLRLLLDWVPNHTSDQHRWFQASRSSREDPKRDWYVWRDAGPDGGPPNNWTRHFAAGAPAWTFDDDTGQYYLHLFLPQQPDLNWSNPEVEAAMHDVLRFWLDRGVAGFRADVVHLIGKDPDLRDDPPELEGTPRSGFHDAAVTHDLLRRIRAVLDEYDGHRMMVGEVNLHDTEAVARYYGDGDELHLSFNFGLLRAPWDADHWRAVIGEVDEVYAGQGAWPTWVLSNHDEVRHRSRYGSVARARAAALVLLTLRGTPFLYAGEELGLEDADVPPERLVDPGGRDGTRAPIPWDGTRSHGWPVERAWLPWPPDAEHRNVADLRTDAGSILHLYRELLAHRRGSRALRLGGFQWLDAPHGTLAYRRTGDGDERVVVANFGDAPREVPVGGDWTVAVSSAGGRRGAYDGRLGATEAVVLQPVAGTPEV